MLLTSDFVEVSFIPAHEFHPLYVFVRFMGKKIYQVGNYIGVILQASGLELRPLVNIFEHYRCLRILRNEALLQGSIELTGSRRIRGLTNALRRSTVRPLRRPHRPLRRSIYASVLSN